MLCKLNHHLWINKEIVIVIVTMANCILALQGLTNTLIELVCIQSHSQWFGSRRTATSCVSSRLLSKVPEESNLNRGNKEEENQCSELDDWGWE